MYETAAAFRDLLKWIFQSWWRAAITGFILGTGATGCAALIIAMLDKTGNGNLTYAIALVAYLPAEFVLGGLTPEQNQALFARFGTVHGILINGVLLGILFGIFALIVRLLTPNKTD
jgi:hypothetical protein